MRSPGSLDLTMTQLKVTTASAYLCLPKQPFLAIAVEIPTAIQRTPVERLLEEIWAVRGGDVELAFHVILRDAMHPVGMHHCNVVATLGTRQ